MYQVRVLSFNFYGFFPFNSLIFSGNLPTMGPASNPAPAPPPPAFPSKFIHHFQF